MLSGGLISPAFWKKTKTTQPYKFTWSCFHSATEFHHQMRHQNVPPVLLPASAETEIDFITAHDSGHINIMSNKATRAQQTHSEERWSIRLHCLSPSGCLSYVGCSDFDSSFQGDGLELSGSGRSGAAASSSSLVAGSAGVKPEGRSAKFRRWMENENSGINCFTVILACETQKGKRKRSGPWVCTSLVSSSSLNCKENIPCRFWLVCILLKL